MTPKERALYFYSGVLLKAMITSNITFSYGTHRIDTAIAAPLSVSPIAARPLSDIFVSALVLPSNVLSLISVLLQTSSSLMHETVLLQRHWLLQHPPSRL